MLQKLTFTPGINRENTNYTNEGGWYEMDKVRFKFGTPEKIGGWQTIGTDSFDGLARDLVLWSTLDGEKLIGVGTNTRYYISYGGVYNNITPLRLTAEDVENPLSTTVGSSIVRVTYANHSAKAGDWVQFSGATAVGGLSAAVISAEAGYRVAAKIDENTFTVDFGVMATSSTTGGGTLTIYFELTSGSIVFSSGNGWGAGPWNGPLLGNSAIIAGTGRQALDNSQTTIEVNSTTGFSASGQLLVDGEIITYTDVTSTQFLNCTRGSNGSSAVFHSRRQLAADTWEPLYVYQVIGYSGDTGWGETSDVTFSAGTQMRVWSSDAFGEDLIFAPRGGNIFYWTKDTLEFTRAQILRDSSDDTLKFVPHTVNYVLVSDVSMFVMALGANPYDPTNEATDFDPLLVRWSSQAQPGVWVPSATNQSGEIRLSAGSYIMTGASMRQETLVWTDGALYSMQYVGNPYVFRTELIMSNLSIMGPNAVALVNNTAYWMGTDKFYIYNGRVDTLPCTLSRFIFDDLAFGQRFQVFAGTNEGFNEIWWFYVSTAEMATATSEGREPTCDKYVIFNHAENIWYYGTMRRTAWLDSPLDAGPIAATLNADDEGILVLHEQGTDEVTNTATNAIASYIQSTDFDIGDGHQFLFVTRMLPDVSFNGSVVSEPEVTLSLYPRQNTGAAYGTRREGAVQSVQSYSPSVKQYTVQEFTEVIQTRVRGRQMAMRIESDRKGVHWKLGTPRIDARPDGRKS